MTQSRREFLWTASAAAAGLAWYQGLQGVHWSAQEAVLATEGEEPWLCAPERWRARHALHQQLLAQEVLADNL